MKVAYLIDKNSVGGGMEYIRRQIAGHPTDVCRIFYADRGECTARRMNDWGAGEIVVNHLKALVQLYRNPFIRPHGRVHFVVHGIHLRRYAWRMREGGLPAVGAAVCRWLRGTLEARLYRRCDLIVALTPGDRDDLRRWYGRELPIAVEPNSLSGWRPRLADRLPDGICGPFKYVCIARFDYQKGQDRWIRHLPQLRRAPDGSPRTLFIGDGETLPACRALARSAGVDDLCVFAGELPDAERYLKCAEWVVSPSRWEGMPYLMMKARALDCRILATDCPGNRDVLTGYPRWTRLDLR
ncbi:MAG: glycosyltransferase [Kiritimatiellia bacterium]